ncbi:hypothetical protein [Clostridium sp. 'White wine YQ']|uniref:hypothetical protein n=1 Tax=Clostridium sp. 'White wine YQ' TaxID=3027474 RepID=UPI002365DB1A|nr:hypothetical protein [Clostridium sp. 'White wine YQ']MDD7793617.1 hypothetical protein [Clostridium sp. 'White wine YQ']
MKIVYRFLLALHLFVGIGAMAGGLAAILNPQSPMGVPTEALKYSPFTDFLIPGLTLFTVIGLGNILCVALFLFKTKVQGYISGVISFALIFWIIIQCIMLNDVVFLHVLFFGIGVVQAFLSLAILFERRQFPTNILIDLYSKLHK